MKPLLRFATMLMLLLIVTPYLQAGDSTEKGDWTELFNGKNLDGWKAKITGYDLGDNFGATFRVEDGLLKVGYDQYDEFKRRFGHLIYTKPFSNYRLRVESRFVGQQVPGGPGWALRNSGIMFHGQTPETMTKGQDFPVSVEVQLLGGGPTGKRPTGNVCTPGTNIVMDGQLIRSHCTSSKSKTYRGDQWVTLVLEVRGNGTVKHIIKGETVLTYSQPQLDERDANAR